MNVAKPHAHNSRLGRTLFTYLIHVSIGPNVHRHDVSFFTLIGSILGGGKTATHSNILAWEIPWTEEPGGLQSMGSQRVGRDLVTKQLAAFKSESVQFSRSLVSNSLRPHGLQHARPPCPSPSPGVSSNSCPLSR